MKQILFALVIGLLIFSCNRVKSGTKTVINKSGEILGKSGSEFAEGVTKGVEESLSSQITISEDLKKKGLEIGKSTIQNDNSGNDNNQLTVYMIFNKDINQEVIVKAYDKEGVEIGRLKTKLQGKADEAKYVDLIFDARTYLEMKSKITIE